MRALTRLPQPIILSEREELWLRSLKDSGNSRPDPSKYGNFNIRALLKSMSFNKCFYCESKLRDLPSEIDHHIEVGINIDLAYNWKNLYLACDNCNRKIDHNTIPITNVLDPCITTDDEIKNHITFNDEIITAKNNSTIGLNTIRKYRLDTEILDKRRLNYLKVFYKALVCIQQNQISENRKTLNSQELEIINRFKQIDQPYSFMFEILLENIPGIR